MKIHFVDSHSYGFFNRTWNYLFVLLAFLMCLFCFAILLGLFIEAVSGVLEYPIKILVMLGGLAVSTIVFLGLMNYTPNIRVYEEGLKVQNFVFWWTFVPWEDVLDLVVWPNPIRPVRVVLVRELTPAHLVMGFIYGHRLKPGFLIISSIDRYHDLIRIIKSRTGLT
jgi:hypothetical protein